MLDKKEQINSHIQISEFHMKKFTWPGNPFLWTWDYRKSKPFRSSPSSFNTRKGYYSKNFEHFLRDCSETPVGNAIHTIRNVVENGNYNTSLSKKEWQALRDFPFLMLSRDEQQIETVIRIFGINPNLPEFEKHEIGTCLLINLLRSNAIYKNSKFQILLNNTDRPFLINSIGSGIVKNSRGLHIYTPLTPKYALYTYCGLSNFLFSPHKAVFITNEETINIINSTIVQSAVIRQSKILLMGYGVIEFPYDYVLRLEQMKSNSYGGQPCLLNLIQKNQQ